LRPRCDRDRSHDSSKRNLPARRDPAGNGRAARALGHHRRPAPGAARGGAAGTAGCGLAPGVPGGWRLARDGIVSTEAAHEDIRVAVRKLCARFPGEYWRRLDRERAYPAEFVAALTESGFLASLIPEEYGGAGLTLSAGAALLEEIHRAGCNGAACHAQM